MTNYSLYTFSNQFFWPVTLKEMKAIYCCVRYIKLYMFVCYSFEICIEWTNKNSKTLDFLYLSEGFLSHLSIFQSHGHVTITSDGLQILTYDRHSWSLISDGSLVCHSYTVTPGHPFKMVISEDSWHSHFLPSIWQWWYCLPVLTT